MNESRMDTGFLEIRHIQAGYRSGKWLPLKKYIVINDVHLRGNPGEVIGILGKNGSGKSTLLRAIVDSAHRWKGEVCIGGAPLTRGEISYVPQNPAMTLSPWLNVWQEITLSLGLRNADRKTREAVCKNLIEEYALPVPLKRKTSQLSGGQRAKVALLRALCVPDMKLMVLDEPFEGLDEMSRQTVRQVIFTVSKKSIPIILTSHRAEDLQLLHATEFAVDGMPVRHLRPVAKTRNSNAMTGTVNSVHAEALEPPQGEQDEKKFNLSTYSLLGFLIGMTVWWALAELVHNPALLPAPTGVIREMARMMIDVSLLQHFVATLSRAILSWILANIMAIPIGILLGYNKHLYNMFAPWLSVGRSLPVFALVGTAIGLFAGYPDIQRGFLIWLTLFLISLQTISLSSAMAPRGRMQLAHALGASRWYIISRILPFESIAGVFTALEVTLPLAMIVTLVVETFLIPQIGLGIYIFNHIADADLSLLFAHILWPGLIAATGVWMLRRIAQHYRFEA